MWWDRRLYLAVCCTGMLARWSYRAALEHLNAVTGWAAFITLWLPVAILLGLLASVLIPIATRKLSSRGHRTG